MQLVSPEQSELAAALQFTMQGAIQRWLGDLIQVQTLAVTAMTLTNIDLQYVVRAPISRERDILTEHLAAITRTRHEPMNSNTNPSAR